MTSFCTAVLFFISVAMITTTGRDIVTGIVVVIVVVVVVVNTGCTVVKTGDTVVRSGGDIGGIGIGSGGDIGGIIVVRDGGAVVKIGMVEVEKVAVVIL